MSTTYLRHPAGYPVTVFGVRPAGSGWRVRADVWHTATSHDGWCDCEGVYASREDALGAARTHARQQGGEVQS